MADIPATDVIIKWGNPYIVSRKDEKLPIIRTATEKVAFRSMFPPIPGRKETSTKGINKQTEDVLDMIFQPKQWEDDGLIWRQNICREPATRLEVMKMGEMLNIKLKQKQARELGLCPIRRHLYSECFDELIRQVTINCAERGLLLYRVREELLLTIAAYESLYESSMAFGIRKIMMTEEGKEENEELITSLKQENLELRKKVDELQYEIKKNERCFEEKLRIEKKKLELEIESLQMSKMNLKNQLEAIVNSKLDITLFD